ncbi:unnamed protein product, partial [Rotaria magnacalcarata]
MDNEIAPKRFLQLYHSKDSFNTFCPINSSNSNLYYDCGTLYDDHGTSYDDHGTSYDDHGTSYDDHGTSYDDHGTSYDDHGTLYYEYGHLYEALRTDRQTQSMLYNSGDFGYFRHQLLSTPTHAEYEKTDNSIIYNQTRDKNMQNQVMKPVDNTELTTRKRLIIHQRHEKRLGNNHRHIHELWSRTFHQTDIMNTVLIIGTYLNHNLKTRIGGQDEK